MPKRRFSFQGENVLVQYQAWQKNIKNVCEFCYQKKTVTFYQIRIQGIEIEGKIITSNTADWENISIWFEDKIRRPCYVCADCQGKYLDQLNTNTQDIGEPFA